MGGGRGDGDAHVFQFGARASFFFCAGIALDDFTKFLDAGIFLAELEKSHTFFEMRGCQLETFGIVGDDFVVLLDGGVVILLRVRDFT